MALFSEGLSKRPKCLYEKRTPLTFRPNSGLSKQLVAASGRLCGPASIAVLIPLKDALCACGSMGPLHLGCAQDIPPQMSPCSSSHRLLGHLLRPITSCSLPITHPKLGGPDYKANLTSSSRSVVSLRVPLSFSASSSISSSKALLSLAE